MHHAPLGQRLPTVSVADYLITTLVCRQLETEEGTVSVIKLHLISYITVGDN